MVYLQNTHFILDFIFFMLPPSVSTAHFSDLHTWDILFWCFPLSLALSLTLPLSLSPQVPGPEDQGAHGPGVDRRLPGGLRPRLLAAQPLHLLQ